MKFLSLQPFVPSGSNFEASKQLFQALDFTIQWDAGDYVGFENNGCKFILQNFDNRQFAENFMLTVAISNAEQFRKEVIEKQLPEKFGIRIGNVSDMPYGREVNIIDLAGVCWHFVECRSISDPNFLAPFLNINRRTMVMFKTVNMKYVFIFLFLVGLIRCTPKLSPDSNWSGRRWVLTEMKGVPVQLSGGRRDAYINFDAVEKKFAGNGGCNQISGSYNLDKKEIRFGEVISTKMSCQDIDFENTFLSTLSSIDRYEQNGNDLLLKRKKEVLLRFSVRNSGF